MGTVDPLTVTPAQLVAHADLLFHLSSDVATARSAGQQVRMDAGAYGKVCVAIPIAMDALQDKVIDAIDTAAHGLYDGGVKLREAAGNYQTSDSNAAAVMANTRVRSAL
ncbi:MAG TPA: type VII secretion target [Micromonosporaceae bacterium]|jgi:hypothetical protein